MSVNFATTRDEGDIASPIDITGQSPYMGQVGLGGSYYKMDVIPGSQHHISVSTYIGYSNIEVYDDDLFTNNVCVTKNNSCNITVGATITSLYLKVPPSTTVLDVYYYYIENWQITSPVYYLQLFKTLNTPDYTLCTNIQMFEEDAITPLAGLHVIENACSNVNLDATVALESGKSYYLYMPDASGNFQNIVDYFTVWLGTSRYTGQIELITPDQFLNEPGNNAAIGATNIAIDALHYDSFTSTDNDWDYFKITVP